MSKLKGKAKAKARKLKAQLVAKTLLEKQNYDSVNQAIDIAKAKAEAQKNQAKIDEIVKDDSMMKITFEIEGASYGFHSWAVGRNMPKQLDPATSSTLKDINNMAMADAKDNFPQANEADIRVLAMSNYVATVMANGFLKSSGNKGFGLCSELVQTYVPQDTKSIHVKVRSIKNPTHGMVPGVDAYAVGLSTECYIELVNTKGETNKITIDSLRGDESVKTVSDRNWQNLADMTLEQTA